VAQCRWAAQVRTGVARSHGAQSGSLDRTPEELR
jgi:hypothetical protein